MVMISEQGKYFGISPICYDLDFPRSAFYRHILPKEKRNETRKKFIPENSLSKIERKNVVDIMNSERFVNQTPYEIFATLLDEGKYFCSISTMYRILRDNGEVRERRNQLNHPVYTKPELLAIEPNQVWSWDITKLKGPVKWTYFQLYVIMDIFSRFIVGWLLANRESSKLAAELIEETCYRQNIEKDQLVIHSDRGTSMTSKTVSQLLMDLSVIKSLNRPHVSNDNPYSESQFKTMKYNHEFPKRFGSIEDARAFCLSFVDWYNYDHKHSGIGFMTPATVHFNKADIVYQQREKVLYEASIKFPERFKGKISKPPVLPNEVWINKPEKSIFHMMETGGVAR